MMTSTTTCWLRLADDRTFGLATTTLLLVTLATGCRFAHPVPRDELGAWKSRYHDATAAYADLAPREQFVDTGHHLGCADGYPMNLRGSTMTPRDPIDAVVLLDQAFGELDLTAVEFDVRRSPLDDDGLVVTHDVVGARPSKAAAAYIERNALRAVLERFVSAGHLDAGRLLFIEIKAPHRGHDLGDLDDDSVDLLRRVTAAIEQVERSHPDASRLRRGIAFLSFSFPALHELHERLAGGDDDAPGCGYFLMATSNRFPGLFYLPFALPSFGDAVVARLTETPWLTGTVFAPRWVGGFVETFNTINGTRREQGLRPLDLHLAVYAEPFENHVRTMRRATDDGANRLRHVAGFVYDLSGRPVDVSDTILLDGSVRLRPAPPAVSSR